MANAQGSQTMSEVDELKSRIAELEAERNNLRIQRDDHERELEFHSTNRVNQRAEVAALRKALEDAPHERFCRSHITCSIPEHGCMPCSCWKAKIPQPTPRTLAASSPAGERAGNDNA